MESVGKYFGIPFTDHGSALSSDIPAFYDGKRYHFTGADGEATYFATVEQVFDQGNGLLRLEGSLYDANADEKPVVAAFSAVVQRQVFSGKKTFALVSIATRWHE